jgi:TatD DNase family protein
LILVDTHAHLDANQFAGDLEEVISRARAADVRAVITVGTDLDSSRAAVALAEEHPGIFAAVGIHPHEAARAGSKALVELAHLSVHPNVVAIGETGLDFYRNLSPPDRQREVFVAQLKLARKVDKPVIIHDRDAHPQVLAILKDTGVGWRGVLHCYSGDYPMALEAMDMGFYISIAGPVTFQNARRLQALVCELPLDRVLVETDCPYLAPHPHRGRRNEPAYVCLVADKIAELRGLSRSKVADITTDNASRLFGLPDLPRSCGTEYQA